MAIIRMSNPIGINNVADLLQTQLGLLDYIDFNGNQQAFFSTIYPMVERNEAELRKGQPMVWIDGTSYQMAVPNNREKAICFLYDHDNTVLTQKDIFEYEISLVVWYVEKLFTKQGRGFKEAFMRKIYADIFREGRINKYLSLDGYEEFRTKPEVWRDFPHGAFLPNDSPYNSFRIKFKARYNACNDPDDFIGDDLEVC
jgi:hypothetical protein